jgi:DNA-binding NarL/FixJ family response regulator
MSEPQSGIGVEKSAAHCRLESIMNSDLIFTEAEPLPFPTEASSVGVVLIGPKAQFPDCLCRVMLSEIDGSRLLRLASLAEFPAAIEARRMRPQLVIIDDSLWETVDEAFLNRMRLDAGAVVAIAFRDTARVLQLIGKHLLQGPINFLPMDLNIQSWLTIVRLLLTGYPFAPPELAKAFCDVSTTPPVGEQVAASKPNPTASHDPDPARSSGAVNGKLTPRETEVLSLMALGLQNKHIAGRLDLSEHTVKLHVHKVISKLGAANRTDAAIRFHQHAEG